jgi:TPP-dependent pyruvate/acetoin dehydrogenase alpha subunit
MEYYKARDPVENMRKKLSAAGCAEKEILDLEKRVEAEIESAAEYCKNSPEPSVEKFLEVCE